MQGSYNYSTFFTFTSPFIFIEYTKKWWIFLSRWSSELRMKDIIKKSIWFCFYNLYIFKFTINMMSIFITMVFWNYIWRHFKKKHLIIIFKLDITFLRETLFKIFFNFLIFLIYRDVRLGDIATVGECRPLSKTVRFNVLKVSAGTGAKKQFRKF